MRFPYSWMIPIIFIFENATSNKNTEMLRGASSNTSSPDDLNETRLQSHKHSQDLSEHVHVPMFKGIYEDAEATMGRRDAGAAGSAGVAGGWGAWGPWSVCLAGLRTRRRYCLQRHLCRDSLRVETRRCGGGNWRRVSGNDARRAGEAVPLRRRAGNVVAGADGGGGGGDSAQAQQRRLRGFSPWSPWSKCSRKCTTVRRRHCRRRALCGRRVLRESAYCYLDGSYCQLWISSRMMKNNSDSYEAPRSRRPGGARTPRRDSSPPCGRINLPGSLNHLRSARKWPTLRIIGGRTASPGKWPWQVVVLNRFKEAFCGGTLVSLAWVVTAAHCVRQRLFVRLGEHDLRTRGVGELELRVAEAVVHPRYNPETVDNDVAMLRLPTAGRPELGHGVACLPRPYQPLPPHTSCTILGWGKRSAADEYGTDLLQEAQVSTVSQSVCRRVYWQYAITDNMVCAGRGRRDSCAGDSGGPLLCRQRDGDVLRYFLHGITSFGDGCGKRGKYGIYTRTANYVPWIQYVLRRRHIHY